MGVFRWSKYEVLFYLRNDSSPPLPGFWVVNNIISDSHQFILIADNSIVIILLKKMIVAIVFGHIQMILVDEIINF